MPIFSSTVNDLQGPGASYKFSEFGSGNMNIADSVSAGDHDIGLGSFSVEVWFRSTANGTASAGYVLNKLDGSGSTTKGWLIYYYMHGSSNRGQIGIQLFDQPGIGSNASIFSDRRYNDDKWHHFAFTLDRGTDLLSIYVDGVLENPRSGMTNPMDVSAYSDVDWNMSGRTKWGDGISSWGPFDGEISKTRIYNRALSADEVADTYSGKVVPFQYRGASQTNLVSNPSFESYNGNDFTSWIEGVNYDTITVDTSNQYTGSASAKYTIGNSVSAYSNVAAWLTGLETGKTYELTFWAKTDTLTGNNPFLVGERLSSDSNGSWNHTSFAATGVNTWTRCSITLVSNNPSYPGAGNIYIARGASYNTAYAGANVWIDDVSLTQIGCVGEYLPSGITKDSWIDTSGNDAHAERQTIGTSAPAVATNYKRGSLTLENIHTTAMSFTGTADSGATLDSYEKGTWTPFFLASTTDFSSITYASNTATYIRIGNIVHIQGTLATDDITVGSAAGYLLMGGLPYKSLAGYVNCFAIGFTYNWASDQTPMALRVSGGSTVAYFDRMLANSSYVGFGAILQYNALKDGTSSNWMQFGGTYVITT